MKVDVLRSTDRPERLVCQAARGDYFEGYVGDTEYEALMEDVKWDDSHLDGLAEMYHRGDDAARAAMQGDINSYKETGELNHWNETHAKTRSFIEKQLSRGHYGPWEHPQITFAVEGVSRVTMAQITRHRHLTFDIQSMRYADFSEQEIVTPVSLRDPDHFSRETGVVDIDDRDLLREEYEETLDELVELYERLVRSGVPKEDARFILPLGTTVNMTFSGNARSFLHLLDMRKKANAQWEIRELSEALLDELFEWMPFTFNYYAENGPNKLSP